MRVQVLDADGKLLENYKTLHEAMKTYKEPMVAAGFRANLISLADFLELSRKKLYIPKSEEIIERKRI